MPRHANVRPQLGPMRNVGVGEHVPEAIAAFAVGGAVVWLLARLERKLTAAP